MRIDDLASLPSDVPLKADLLIIGAGPAGLTLARELGGSGINVIVCESGTVGDHQKYYDLNQVEITPDDHFDPRSPVRVKFFTGTNPVWTPDVEPYGARIRAYGGSTAYWGGKAATFDENDFSQRDWVPHSGWPLYRSEIARYFDRAGAMINIGPNIYDDHLWPLLGKPKPEPRLDDEKLRTTFWQFSRSHKQRTDIVRFERDHREIPGDNLRTITNATVTRIDLEDDLRTFKGVEVSTLDGQRRTIRAFACVLAASAIENPRLLLASNHQLPEGVGNRHDVVGRYLMDHPGTLIGHFPLEAVKKVSRHFGYFGLQWAKQTHMYMQGLLLGGRKQAEEGLLNAALFTLEGVAPDDPVQASKRLMKLKSDTPLKDISSVIGGAGILLRGFGMKMLDSGAIPGVLKDMVIGVAIRFFPNMVVREYQNVGVPHKLANLEIYSLTEQAPNPESRIRLGTGRDRFGTPRARVEWRLTGEEARSVMRLAQITADEFEAKGLPRPVLDDWIVEERPQDARFSDMAHPSGTTRMGNDPATSVVDANCKVHGIEGLYVAGSSIFPTSGQANPTLMIMSFAIRLADHLKSVVFGHEPDAPTPQAVERKIDEAV